MDEVSSLIAALSAALAETAREIDRGDEGALARAGEFFDMEFCCPLAAIIDCEALADDLTALAERQ